MRIAGPEETQLRPESGRADQFSAVLVNAQADAHRL